MAVTFLDPTLPSRLPSRFETIDARVTTPLNQLTVSLRLPNGKWDVIFQDGLLGLEYAQTTITNNGVDDNTLHITRVGGWPPGLPLSFRFKEPEPATAAELGPIYSVDFRALPNQAIGAAGSYTIDGKQWWAKGATTGLASGGTCTSDIVNGQGLRFQSNAVGLNLGTNGDLAHRHLFLPLANIPDYTAAAPLVVRFRFVRGAGDPSVGSFMGLCSSTPDGTRLIAAHRQYDNFIGQNHIGDVQHKRGNAGQVTQGFAGVSQFEDCAMGLVRAFGQVVLEAADPVAWAGAFTDINGWSYVNTSTFYASSARPTPGIMLAHITNGQATPCFITHLEVLQPKVAD
jgi:hypothetical protein